MLEFLQMKQKNDKEPSPAIRLYLVATTCLIVVTVAFFILGMLLATVS